MAAMALCVVEILMDGFDNFDIGSHPQVLSLQAQALCRALWAPARYGFSADATNEGLIVLGEDVLG